MMDPFDQLLEHAGECIARCRTLALYSEEPGFTTRTFLSEPMRGVHADVGRWMRTAGMSVKVDAAGNIRGSYPAAAPDERVLYIGSHLDTVPHAGAFDGILGVILGIKLVELLQGRGPGFGIEVIGFSEEEGVRFGFPFIGSRALIGELDGTLLAREDGRGSSVAAAIAAFGLNPDELPAGIAGERPLGYFEIHIEQGPVLENLNFPVGIVDAVAGQTRMELTFEGRAGHAGTTPMNLRKDALAGAAEWIVAVESKALAAGALVATVGRVEVQPGASNVIPGAVRLTLDVRDKDDGVRRAAVACLLSCAETIARRRALRIAWDLRLDQPAVAMDVPLTATLAHAVERAGYAPHTMLSGAGHDAMVLARVMPAAMLFVRSPNGLSHHPDESVIQEDVAAALRTGLHFLEELEAS